MYELDEKDIEYIKEQNFFCYTIIKKFKKSEKIDYFSSPEKILESSGKCYCKLNGGKEIIGLRCPYCFHEAYKIYPKEFEMKENYWHKKSYQGPKQFYVKPTEEGILLYNYSLLVNPVKNIGDEPKESVKLNYVVDVNIGKKSKAYKFASKGLNEMDLFEALRINTRTIKDSIDILFKDAVGLIDFSIKNKEFAKRTGAIDFLNLVDVEIPQNMKFLTYIYILSEYPAVELLVKMGYIRLISSMFNRLVNCGSKEIIREQAKEFNRLIKDSTKGSDCLMIPKFAADYLNIIGAGIDNYDRWSTIFSYQNLSKEHFLKLIYEIGCTNLGPYELELVTEIIKYGYDVEKLISYVKKQSEKSEIDIRNMVQNLKDYLEMCSIMGEKPDLYPSNVRTAHDNMQSAYNAKKDKLTDITLKKIADACKGYIPENSTYTIVIPECVNDFVSEGQNQHNCVASYVNNVTRRNNIIFFIREKNNAAASYITAEYRNGSLIQIKSRNNNPVYKEEILNYAREFCDKLRKNERRIYI